MAKNNRPSPLIVANRYGDLRCDCGWVAESPRLAHEDWERWSIATANGHRGTCQLLAEGENGHEHAG